MTTIGARHRNQTGYTLTSDADCLTNRVHLSAEFKVRAARRLEPDTVGVSDELVEVL
jgi:hypothetical protein